VLFGLSPDAFASEVLADVFASTSSGLPFRRLISPHRRRVRRSALPVLHMLPEQSLLLCKIATLHIFIARWVASLWDHFRNASGLDLLNPATARSCFSGWVYHFPLHRLRCSQSVRLLPGLSGLVVGRFVINHDDVFSVISLHPNLWKCQYLISTITEGSTLTLWSSTGISENIS